MVISKRVKKIGMGFVLIIIGLAGGLYFYLNSLFGTTVSASEIKIAEKYCEEGAKGVPPKWVLQSNGRCGVERHTGFVDVVWFDPKSKTWYGD